MEHQLDSGSILDANSLLSKGRIPAYTACPWIAQCMTKRDGKCNHKGTQHKNRFSCGLARAFDMSDEYIKRTSRNKRIVANMRWRPITLNEEKLVLPTVTLPVAWQLQYMHRK